MKLFLGKDSKGNAPVYLEISGSRAMLICGKRGSGKSYTMGVLIEELLNGPDMVIPIVIDPMGIYHTMGGGNTIQSNDLYGWGLTTHAYPVRLLVPGEPEQLYDPEVLAAMRTRGVETVPLRLNPSDLSPDGWCDLFGLNINQPIGIAMFRAVRQLAKQPGFRLTDIMRHIEMDGQAQDVSKQALLNRLEAAALWNIFRTSDRYEPIDAIFAPGVVNVVDVSRLESGPRGLRNLVVSIICRNLFRKRADARLREEFGLDAGLPRVWLTIDEAHQFVPAGGTTLAKEQIIRWAKEGRQPGLSLVVATQQPSAVDNEVLSQCDIILSHKLTTKADVAALNSLSQDYMGGELRTFIKQLNRSGESVLVDDERESVTMLRIRPRQSSHGGSSVTPTEQEQWDLWKPL
jgi:DNA helicase HerA-like ATPase